MAEAESAKVCPYCGTAPGRTLTCSGCGTNLMYARLITRADWDARQARAEGGSGGLAPVTIRRTAYLGGHPVLGADKIPDVRVVIDDNGWMGTRSVSVDSVGREDRRSVFLLPWTTIDRVEIRVGGSTSDDDDRGLASRSNRSARRSRAQTESPSRCRDKRRPGVFRIEATGPEATPHATGAMADDTSHHYVRNFHRFAGSTGSVGRHRRRSTSGTG